jgi:hypothetical protein
MTPDRLSAPSPTAEPDRRGDSMNGDRLSAIGSSRDRLPATGSDRRAGAIR